MEEGFVLIWRLHPLGTSIDEELNAKVVELNGKVVELNGKVVELNAKLAVMAVVFINSLSASLKDLFMIFCGPGEVDLDLDLSSPQ